MFEESTTPDLVQLMRGLSSVKETMRYYAPGAVYDMSKPYPDVEEARADGEGLAEERE